jgi:hypothetical protein
VKSSAAQTFKAFLIELVVYSALVIGYFFLVLHLLGSWLNSLALGYRYTYAGVAILMIVGQAILLEAVTTFLMRLIRGRSE